MRIDMHSQSSDLCPPPWERVTAIYDLVTSGPTTIACPAGCPHRPYTVPLSIVRTLSEFYGSPDSKRILYSNRPHILDGYREFDLPRCDTVYRGRIKISIHELMWASVVFIRLHPPPQLSSSIDVLKLGGQRDDRCTLQPFFRVLAQVLERFSGDVGVKGRFAGVLFRHFTIVMREGEKIWDGG
jgi:hypothetical protein